MAESWPWENLPDYDASSQNAGDINGLRFADGKSSGSTAPVKYPRYVGPMAILGFTVAVGGFVLSVVFVSVWPVMILIGGLLVLGLSSLSARRAERKSSQINIDSWNLYQWDSTKLPNLLLQVDRTSPTA